MKKNQSSLSPKLRNNWWIDAALAIGALTAILSSLYFLAFPDGGFQGGRNPYYDLRVILNRQEWDILHTWSGIVMIFAALVHIIIHWDWITGTVGRTWQVIIGKRTSFGSRLTYNIILDAVIGISFIICAISGMYFMFFAESGPTGEIILFSKTTWDLIHTWSGVLMTITAVLHFILHWKWITNITGKMFKFRQKQIVNQPMTENSKSF